MASIFCFNLTKKAWQFLFRNFLLFITIKTTINKDKLFSTFFHYGKQTMELFFLKLIRYISTPLLLRLHCSFKLDFSLKSDDFNSFWRKSDNQEKRISQSELGTKRLSSKNRSELPDSEAIIYFIKYHFYCVITIWSNNNDFPSVVSLFTHNKAQSPLKSCGTLANSSSGQRKNRERVSIISLVGIKKL